MRTTSQQRPDVSRKIAVETVASNSQTLQTNNGRHCMQPLGEGGTGETYLVKRNDNQVEEAVKVIRRPVPKALQELLTNEIVLQSSIGEGHDSIVQARSVILTETHICLFMDFISGGTLADLVHDKAAVKQPGKLVMDEDEARYIFRVRIP